MGTKERPGEFDCLANAKQDEPFFVLLARDAMAPTLVRQWVGRQRHRMKIGLLERNERELRKIAEAELLATAMERWRRDNVTAAPQSVAGA